MRFEEGHCIKLPDDDSKKPAFNAFNSVAHQCKLQRRHKLGDKGWRKNCDEFR